MPEPALVRKTLACRPGARQDLDGLVEASLRLVRRNLKALEFAVPVTLADPKVEPAMRQKIERGCFFGEQHRIVPWRHDHCGAEAQCCRAHSKRAEQHQGRGYLVPAAEMMLDREARMKPKRLSHDVEVKIVEESASGLGTKSRGVGFR